MTLDNIIIGLLIAAFVPAIITLIWCLIGLLKSIATYKAHIIICEAIHNYRVDCINKGKSKEVDFDDMEDYDATYNRFWDWGYKRILPKEKYKIIKSYIKGKRGRRK